MLAGIEAADILTVIAKKMQDNFIFMSEFKELFIYIYLSLIHI